MGPPGALFSSRLKNKKYLKNSIRRKFFIFFQRKVFLIFREMELYDPKIKKVFKFYQKKVFLIFQETKLSSLKFQKFWEKTFRAWKIKKLILKKFLIFQEMKLSLISQEGICKAWKTKIYYISGNGTAKDKFSYICQKKQNFLNKSSFLKLLKKEIISKSSYKKALILESLFKTEHLQTYNFIKKESTKCVLLWTL